MNRFSAGIFFGAIGAAIITMPLHGIAQNPAAGQPAVFTAPFSVVGQDGRPIMTVEEGGSGPLMTVFGTDGGMVKIGSGPAGMAVTAFASSTKYTSLLASSSGSVINMVSGTRSVSMLMDDSQQIFDISDGEKKLVSLGNKPGTNMALRVYDPKGTVVAQIGSNQGNSGAGSVYVSDPTGTTTGYLVSKDDGTAVVGIGINKNDVAKLEPNVNKSGGKLTLADTSGTIAVNLGATTTGGGAVCVFGKSNSQCIQPK